MRGGLNMISTKQFRKQLYRLAVGYNIPPDNVCYNSVNGSFWIDIPSYILPVQVKEIRERLEMLAHNFSDGDGNGY